MPNSDGRVTVAAIGDLHVTESSVAPYRELFAQISREADIMVLCGDLTNFGKTSEAEILAEDLRGCDIPVLGVLGNHDYECGQPDKVAEILHDAGMTVLDDQAVEVEGIGFAGCKGFIGGFGRGELAPFGEPEVKAFVDIAVNEARKLENALRSLRTDRAVAVLHYSPVVDTLEHGRGHAGAASVGGSVAAAGSTAAGGWLRSKMDCAQGSGRREQDATVSSVAPTPISRYMTPWKASLML